MITVTIHGARGEGKTVLAEFVQRQLGSHGVPSELTKGGNPRGPDHDTLRLDLPADSIPNLL